jgi:glycosyltransferase involved in cell wall biosynthesis
LYSRGHTNVNFILTLKDQDFKQHIAPHPAVKNVGPVKPEECPSLYQECDILLLPTLAECFSASYAEAMVMEKPITTTDLGFARSICGNAAQYYEASNAKAAADVIEMMLIDEDLCNEMIVRGKDEVKKFDNPKTRAHKYLQLCKSLIS